MKIAFWDDNDKVKYSRLWEFGARGPLRHCFDYVIGVKSWDHMADFLGRWPDEYFTEIQVWGHGKRGHPLINGTSIEAHHAEDMKRATQEDAIIWFRQCAVFADNVGRQFATNFSCLANRRIAAHTFNIALSHSGLHVIHPYHHPDWPEDEGLKDGKVLWSRYDKPCTIKWHDMEIPRHLL